MKLTILSMHTKYVIQHLLFSNTRSPTQLAVTLLPAVPKSKVKLVGSTECNGLLFKTQQINSRYLFMFSISMEVQSKLLLTKLAKFFRMAQF